MGFDFNLTTPIFLQIIEYVKEQILSGKFLPNQKLPSVREFALMFEVNPNTVQKALTELEETGLIFTDSTNGKFVTTDIELLKKTREIAQNKIIEDFFSSMEKIGVSKTEAFKIINKKEIL